MKPFMVALGLQIRLVQGLVDCFSPSVGGPQKHYSQLSFTHVEEQHAQTRLFASVEVAT